MQFKSILALSMVALAATAAPADDLEARQAGSCAPNAAYYCCDGFIPFNFLFIRGIGEGRCVRRKSIELITSWDFII